MLDAGNHNSVIDISAAGNDQARLGIDRHRFVGIVEARIEHVIVAPQRVIGLHNRLPDTQFELQLRSHFPGVLGEEFEHVAAGKRVVARPDFGVGVELAESQARDSRASFPESLKLKPPF